MAEPSSPTEEEEEEEEEEQSVEPRPRTRSNPEGAEDRALGAQTSVGSRSEGEGEAASADDGTTNALGAGPKPWQVPPPAPEVQVRTPRVNCPEKVVSGNLAVSSEALGNLGLTYLPFGTHSANSPFVLVSWGCHDKLQYAGRLKKHVCFLTVLETRSLKSRC